MNAGAVRAGLSGGAIVGLLTGCAGIIQPQSGMPLSGPAQRVLHPPEQQRTAAAFKTLYSFNEPPDGATPYAPLAYMGGYFYGTTLYRRHVQSRNRVQRQPHRKGTRAA
jgi:hypothetical protein